MFLKFLAIVKEKIVVNPWSGPACEAALTASYVTAELDLKADFSSSAISACVVAELLGVMNPDVSQSEE